MPNKIPHFRLFLFAGPIVAIGLVLLAMTGPFGPEVARGLFWGVMCGQTTAAAAWCALGPARLAWRLPASLVWIAVLAAIDAFTRRHYLATANHGIAVVMEVLGQWLLIQIVLLVSVSALGVQLRHRDDDGEIDPRMRQFGIRQLLVATTIHRLRRKRALHMEQHRRLRLDLGDRGRGPAQRLSLAHSRIGGDPEKLTLGRG